MHCEYKDRLNGICLLLIEENGLNFSGKLSLYKNKNTKGK
jgi:hypothetical protein